MGAGFELDFVGERHEQVDRGADVGDVGERAAQCGPASHADGRIGLVPCRDDRHPSGRTLHSTGVPGARVVGVDPDQRTVHIEALHRLAMTPLMQVGDPEQPRHVGRRRPREHRSAGSRLQGIGPRQMHDHLVGEEGGLFGVMGHEHGGETGVALELAKFTSKFVANRAHRGPRAVRRGGAGPEIDTGPGPGATRWRWPPESSEG